MKKSESLSNLSQAFALFQSEVSNPPNSSVNPQFRSKYAPLDVVINTVKPILAKYGLSFIQSTSSVEESVAVTTLLMHESGEWIESDPLTLPAYQLKKGGEKDFNAQGCGSGLTYARRYSLSAMLGISSEDDDDANVAVFNSSTPANTSSPSVDDKEKKKAEALARAKAKKDAQNSNDVAPEDLPFKKDEESASTNSNPVTDGQLKAIGNVLKLIANRKGSDFNEAEFIAGVLGEVCGKSTVEELTEEEAKEAIQAFTKEMKKR